MYIHKDIFIHYYNLLYIYTSTYTIYTSIDDISIFTHGVCLLELEKVLVQSVPAGHPSPLHEGSEATRDMATSLISGSLE